MKILHIALAAFAMIAFTGNGSAADEKIDYKKLLVGKWEVTKADQDTVAVGSTVEFTAEGKLNVREKGGDVPMLSGSYTVDGNTFTIALKFGDEEFKQKITINKVTETELETTDKDKKAVTLKRVK